ncbi:response regulator transcription factor [Halochromatium glycolicum]|uniref:DNA-binding response regulator n=1 Tax=Halochromatium glycolicum TaxID=85075 RepID=A0AAJ0U9S2_9GAMM|nr:response regulator transcription factor [Halochromatium glycolicum]MBK1706857.1 DNA-binding response regulator [Halochromatium glycolicum]
MERINEPEPEADIVVVEDDQRMARMIERNLHAAGYHVRLAETGRELRNAYHYSAPDLVLLDLNLQAEDGIDLAVELVSATSAAVIIVTARDRLEDRLRGLDVGADDYIIKPFEIEELIARIRAVLRRRILETARNREIDLGPYHLDRTAQTLVRDGSPPITVSLTNTEVRILTILLLHHSRVVCREQLTSREIKESVDRSIDVHIGNIRRKLRKAGMHDLVIWPVRGLGYRLRYEA